VVDTSRPNSSNAAEMKTLQEAPDALKTVTETPADRQTIQSENVAPADPSGPIPPGQIADALELDDAPLIPGYRIEKVLGQGGMGKVYRGSDLQTGREVAIKALIPKTGMSFNSYRAFNREIEVTRQLQHPNIVQFIGVGKLKGAYYCVLEFVNGMDLRTFVKTQGGSISIQQAAPIMLGILEGLSYAHRKTVAMQAMGRTNVFKGIVHRDLKPENILLGNERGQWIPKVADFGLSKSFESAGMTDMTMAGVAGTPAYWPREQITHYRYLHPATDVFSIAAVFYEILSNGWARPGLKQMIDSCRARGRAAQISDFIRVIGDNAIKPIRSVVPSIPRLVADVLDRALRETEVPVDEIQMRKTLSELRYRDAGEFREALAAALKESGIAV
jgi:eukaryotic-like serine/threonine-protein kinase